MAPVINLKVKSDFAAASADLKKFGTISEAQAKKIEKFQKSFKTEQIDKFTDRANRNAAAIKATRGPVDALTAEYKQYQRQIETLIRRGLDPEDDKLKGLTKRYKQLEKEIIDTTKAQQKQEKRAKFLKGALIGVGAGAVLAGKKLVDMAIDFGKESAKAASDAEEIEGKFQVVFRSISDEATAAAATIAKDFDLANSTVNKLLGDTGDILTGLGFDQKTALGLSESVGTLALDLASFTNFAGGAEGASAALTKALLGEAESAKALGIVIRQDTQEYKDMVNEQMEVNGLSLIQAKAMTALAIATEQSKNAIGDYARTSENAANVQRTLDEQIKRSKELTGTFINKALTPLRKWYRGLLTDINDARQAQQDFNAAVEEGRFTDDVIDSVDNYIDSIETAILQSDTAGRSSLEMANIIQDGFGTSKKKALELIAEYGNLDSIGQQTLEDLLQLQEKIDNIERQRVANNEASARASKLEGDALKRLSEITESRKTSQEKQAEALQLEIDTWAKFRDEGIVGSQELLNELIVERDKLLAQINPKLEEQNDHYRTQAELENVLMGVEQERRGLLEAGASLKAAKLKEEEDQLKAVESQYQSIAKTITGFVSGPLTELGKALVAGKADWKDLAKSAIGSVAAVIRALGEQAIAESAIAFAGGRIGKGFLLAGAGAGAFVAAGAVDASANTFQTGTGQPFTVPESAASSRADSQRIAVSPGEEVSVSPRGESGRVQNISFSIARQVIYDIVNEGNESGDIRITAENIQGGAVVA